MKNLLILLSFLWLTGCKMESYCSKHYPSVNSDSVTTEISYCWDTVKVNSPYQDITFDTTGFIDPLIVFHHESKKGRLSSYIDIKQGKLTFKCAEDSLKSVIAYQQKQINTIERNTKTQMTFCNLKHKNGFDSFCRYFFWFVLIALVLRFVIKYFTGK